jgi:hypothetical protein
MIVRLNAAETTTAEVVEYITGSRGVTGGDE